jgi:hypothetical protein
MLKNCYPLTMLFSIIVFCFPLKVFAEVSLSLDAPKNATEEPIYRRLKTSPTVNTAITFINDTFIMPSNITLAFGDYKKIWHENNKIEIPYQFIHDIRAGYNSTQIPHRLADTDTFTGNVLFHVIFHEFAHALIRQYNLPVIGKEEDAADGFADLLLIYFFEGGDQIVTSAADLFYMNAQHDDTPKKEDYWSEHSLNQQRYYDRICHVYGSNPSQHLSLKLRVEFSDDRAQRCIIQYKKLERSWLQLLAPALKITSN